MKFFMFDINLVEVGYFFYKSKNVFDYFGGVDVVVDLILGRIVIGQYDVVVDFFLKYYYGVFYFILG